MPRLEFECRFCEGITGVYLEDGRTLDYRRMRCEHCGKKHLRLILYVRHTAHMLEILQDALAKMAERIEDLENGEVGGQDYEVKN